MHLGIPQTPFFHFHLTTQSSNGMRWQILDTHREFQFLTLPNLYIKFQVVSFSKKWILCILKSQTNYSKIYLVTLYSTYYVAIKVIKAEVTIKKQLVISNSPTAWSYSCLWNCMEKCKRESKLDNYDSDLTWAQVTNTVLAISNCISHDSTCYTVLKHVEVEFWCGICRCDPGTQCWVQWSMSRLPILVLECSKGTHLKEGPCQTEEKFSFFFRGGGWKWIKLAEIFMGESGPPGPPFPSGFTPQALRCYKQACRNPVSRLRGCYVQWSSKKRVTGWHFDR